MSAGIRYVSGLLLAVTAVRAQSLRPGPQVVSYVSEIDGSEQPYGLYVPKNYDSSRKYPLVVSLHDTGSNHRLGLRRVFGLSNLPGESDAEATRHFPAFRNVEFVVVSPLARGSMGYQGIAERDVYDVIADAKKRFSIDDDRVYLTGQAVGGGGALWLALTRPDLWAAVAVVCPTAPAEAADLAPNDLNLPIRFYHGAADPIVSPEVSRNWVAKLRAGDSNVEYTEYPAIRHNSWDRAYKDGAIFDWFGRFKRNRFPDKVRLVADGYRYGQGYWVRIDRLTTGVQADVRAKFVAANRIEVSTKNLTGFTLLLDGHPKYSAAKPLMISIDGRRVVRRGKSLSFSVKGNDWLNTAVVLTDGAKRRGMEGPMADAVGGPHLYVYGTADQPSAGETTARREMAAKAAQWSTPKLKLPVLFRVVADREVKWSDRDQSNLILFGTKETNSVIAEMADTLPMELNAGAADYGLTYVFPGGRHYAVINSGRPWWTGSEFAGRAGVGAFAAPFAVLSSFQDYIVFKGSLEHVVAEGRFDSYWKIPRADAAKLEATGAIRTHD